jgi:hypothetical protein
LGDSDKGRRTVFVPIEDDLFTWDLFSDKVIMKGFERICFARFWAPNQGDVRPDGAGQLVLWNKWHLFTNPFEDYENKNLLLLRLLLLRRLIYQSNGI